jgi:uncharacterized protein (TIGR04255 family)
MDGMTTDLPKRINPDAILEAVVEIRFVLNELPEIFLGRLLSSEVFSGLAATRLPQADIPASARESEASLRFQPIYQLEGEGELIRVGTNALSIHVLPPYWGWARFSARVGEILRATWAECGQPKLQRCGLRYVNALTATGHGIRGIDDLNLEVRVAGHQLFDMTVSFASEDDAMTQAIVRIASIKHVQGEVPEDATFVVDVDVRTSGDVENWRIEEIASWLDRAHDVEKRHFFELLPEPIIERLEER